MSAALGSPSSDPNGRGSRHFVSAVAWSVYVFLIAPSLIVIPISFGNPDLIEFPPRRFSLALYERFFTDPDWWGALLQSLTVATLTTIATVVLVVPAAYALARAALPGQGLLRGVFLLPMLVPVVVLGLGLYLQYSAWGLLDTTAGLVLAHITLTAPFVLVPVLGGLGHADMSLERVALVMGASRPTVFFRVVLPQLRAAIAVGALFTFLISLDEVVVAYFVTGTGTTTLPVRMFSALRWEVSPVIAAVSSLLTGFSLVIAVGLVLLQRGEAE